MQLILFGPPGSGKGTVASLIQQKYHCPILASGDLLRKEIEEKTALGNKVSSFLSAGELVPDSIINIFVEKKLKELEDAEMIILDGYPRTLNQAQALDELTEDKKIVFYLDIPRPILMERLLKRGRSDDTREIIENRFAIYEVETEDLIQYYRDKHLFIPINEDSSEKVFQKIHSFLSSII